MLSAEEISLYHEDGYLFKRKMFDSEECAILFDAAKRDKEMTDNAVKRNDASGGVTKLSVWNHPVDDVYGMFSRSEKLTSCAEQLLEGEVYHYHSKIMLKEPFVGGAWEWHQDYGYWYKNGCLYPLMLSAMIAIDGATKENGCLQVLKGSHKIGRINHGSSGDQLGADMQRVEPALERHELVYCELEPGDVFFLHCNTLHRSAKNTSPKPRWSYIIAYNAARNDPLWDHHHARYVPIQKVPDTAIKERLWEKMEPNAKKKKYNHQEDRGDRTADN